MDYYNNILLKSFVLLLKIQYSLKCICSTIFKTILATFESPGG